MMPTSHEPCLTVVGCDYRVASASWRGALRLSELERAALAAEAAELAGARGLMILDTCARTEWIADGGNARRVSAVLSARMVERWSGLRPRPSPYVRIAAHAARHCLRVAVGLESFTPGEREIAGQWHDAFEGARREGRSSPGLERLASAVGRSVRRVERTTSFRDASRGVHHVVIETLTAVLGALPDGRVGIAGLGSIGTRVADALEQAGCRVVRFNRSDRGTALALAGLPAHVPRLDALVVATSAPHAVLDAAFLAAHERARPLLVLDLGVPPQVVGEQPTVTVLGIDRLAMRARGPDDEQARRATNEVERALRELLRSSRFVVAAASLNVASPAQDA
jgi:glutamyl-tRNA reductase